MYIPKHYQGKDMKATIEFMKKFNFGVLITNDEGVPLATHLPFHITEQGEDIIITFISLKQSAKYSFALRREPYNFLGTTRLHFSNSL